MRIVDVYESKMYSEDKDFASNELKEEYYNSEFWDGADYVVTSENKDKYPSYFFIDWDNEEIIVEYEDDELADKMIKDFVKENHGEYFDELQVGTDYKVEDDPKYDKSKPYIKYRGGSGYGYYHHQYRG